MSKNNQSDDRQCAWNSSKWLFKIFNVFILVDSTKVGRHVNVANIYVANASDAILTSICRPSIVLDE